MGRKGGTVPIYNGSKYPFIKRVRIRRFTLTEIMGFAQKMDVEYHLKRFYGPTKYEKKLADRNPKLLTILITGYLSAARDLRDSLQPERAAYIHRFNAKEQLRKAQEFERKAERLAREANLEHLLRGNW